MMTSSKLVTPYIMSKEIINTFYQVLSYCSVSDF